MAKVANSSFIADGVEIRRTPEDMAHDYSTFTECEPLNDVMLAEVDGQLVGYARCWRWTQADGLTLHSQLGFVASELRGLGIGRELQQWIEQRHREVAASQGGVDHQHHAFVHDQEKARASLLRAAGYAPIRYFFQMLRPDLDDIPDFPLPDGVELRPVLPEHYRLIWDSHILAFRDHWGFSPPTEDHYVQWQRSILFQPWLWQVAWDVQTNTIAGQIRTCINEESNRNLNQTRGWTEFISVARPWRRRGLARAMIGHSLRALAKAGMTESSLGVDGENLTGAVRVYEDCGFRVLHTNAIYRKPMYLPASASSQPATSIARQ